MTRLILALVITLAGFAHADTVQQKIDQLNAKTGVVLAAWMEVAPAPIQRSNVNPQSDPLYLGVIGWIEIVDGAAVRRNNDIIVKDLGDVVEGVNIEQAYWVGSIPTPLRAETKFLSSRTAGGWAGLTRAAQLSAIQTFCNAVYKGAVAGARDIRDFQCEPVDGSTIRVSGYFNTGAGLTTWERQTWFVKLIDPNGSVVSPYDNVEFHRVVETASANQVSASVDTEADEAYAMRLQEQREALQPMADALLNNYMPGIDPYGYEEHEPRQIQQPTHESTHRSDWSQFLGGGVVDESGYIKVAND